MAPPPPPPAPPAAPRLADALAGAVVARLPPPSADWFRAALLVVRETGPAGAGALGAPSPSLARLFSGAGRRLGRAALAFTAKEEALASRSAGGASFVAAGWSLDEAGRAALLLDALTETAADGQVRAVADLFRTGDVGERQALVKTLAYLPGPERYAELAAEASRTHMLSVFEALACENPYPARHLAPAAFRQLVVKALQNGVALARVHQLDARRDPELARMVEAFASERRAAGRPVPADVALVVRSNARTSRRT